MADLQAKYQKLAAEYAKLRAQIPVLKKAVVDEQGKEKELKDVLKEKDQSIRKFEQEIDSLSFRNQQLSKRVLVLQDELDDVETKGKKNKHWKPFKQHSRSNSDTAGIQPEPNNEVFNQELKSKIEENARLHKQVFEVDQEHKASMLELQDRLTVLERESSQHQEILSSTTLKNKTMIEKLQEDKAMLEVRLQSKEKEVKEAKMRYSKAEEKLSSIESELSSQLEVASKTIKDKLPFNDTKLRDLNALNIPTHDRKAQLRTRELISKGGQLIHEMVQGLKNFHSYTEQRSKIYPADGVTDPISQINTKFCELIHEHASYLRPVDQSFNAFQETVKEDAMTTLETAVGLQDFAAAFHKYVAFFEKILNYQLLSLEEECQVSLCTSSLQVKNRELKESFKKLAAVFNKLDTYLRLVAAQSSGTCPHLKSNQPRMFLQLSSCLTEYHQVIKELSSQYNAKVSLEHQLPTATQKLKTTDECVLSSLVAINTSVGKLSGFMTGNLEFLCGSVGYRTRGSSVSTNQSLEGPKCSPLVTGYRQKAAEYMSSLTQPCPKSVPYEVAMKDRKILISSTESREGLSQQVSEFQEKTSKLEQDKEHWMLESQLLKIKYEKETQRVRELEKRLQISESSALEDHFDTIPSEGARVRTNTQLQQLDTTMLGEMATVASASEEEIREMLIKDHYTQRISDLTSQMQLADSKAVNFSAECRALHQRLHLAEKSKVNAEDQLKTANQSITQLKDQLEITTRNYEDQLSMMSEHLAAMNEKLTTQTDEINALKHQLNTKGSKRGLGRLK